MPAENIENSSEESGFFAHTAELVEQLKLGEHDTDEEVKEVQLNGRYSRLLGDTEQNWCRAVASGTGITVLAVLFSKFVEVSRIQIAIDRVQVKHPRLRSKLLWIEGKPAFQVLEHPFVKVECLMACPDEASCRQTRSADTRETHYQQDDVDDSQCCLFSSSASSDDKSILVSSSTEWFSYVEQALNTNVWPEVEHCLQPVPMFAARLHLLAEEGSVLVLRLHTAICDRVSGATVLTDILKTLHDFEKDCPAGHAPFHYLHAGQEVLNEMDVAKSANLVSVEDAIPPGKANKPFWAHGIDLLGYSLGSRRHAFLPFEEPDLPRRSEIVHASLSVELTQKLLQACAKASTSVYGTLCAAGLKAAAAYKQLGKQSEHFAIISLVDCRQQLLPELTESTVGFYHSALMNTHHLNELTDFWELASRCSNTLDNAMRNGKHFTDMGDLNYLMFQAIRHPNLTPNASMRTSLLVLFRDTVQDTMEALAEAVGVEHYIGCSSIHGVGPSLAIFDSMRKGALHFTGVFATPLHSSAQIQQYVRLMTDILVEAAEI